MKNVDYENKSRKTLNVDSVNIAQEQTKVSKDKLIKQCVGMGYNEMLILDIIENKGIHEDSADIVIEIANQVQRGKPY